MYEVLAWSVDEIAGKVGFAGGTSLREHLHAPSDLAPGLSPYVQRCADARRLTWTTYCVLPVGVEPYSHPLRTSRDAALC